MRESDFTDFTETKDIGKVSIDDELTPREKRERYIKEVGSGTVHKVGETTVNCVFGDTPIEKMLSDLIEG
jgi:hypothetical protein